MLHDDKPTYTVVSCHFGDPFWIGHMCAQLDAFSDDRIAQVVVVDQSRDSQEILAQLPRVTEVISFPVDESQVELLGHDHPASLNRAMASLTFTTSHVLVLDSDCFPIAARWLDRIDDVTLASDPRYGGLSHPCFMAFPAAVATALDFSEGIVSIQMDTGRLVAAQIARLGRRIQFTRPEAAFHGYRGHFLLDRNVYHHGSASFSTSPDARLNQQIDQANESLLRSHVQDGVFDLSRRELVEFKLKGARRRALQLVSRS